MKNATARLSREQAYWAEAHELVDSADALSDAAIADLFNEIRDTVRASLARPPVAGKDRQEGKPVDQSDDMGGSSTLDATGNDENAGSTISSLSPSETPLSRKSPSGSGNAL